MGNLRGQPVTLHCPTEAHRLLDHLIQALQADNRVSAIACFGSTVSGDADDFSDVDMLVEASGNLSGIMSSGARPEVRYFRPFGASGREPDGRYWFSGFSVFAKADISFHDADEYAGLLRHGEPERFITPPIKELWRRHKWTPGSPLSRAPRESERSDAETTIGKHLYHAIKAIAGHARGALPRDEAISAANRLRDAWSPYQGDQWAGGDLDSLVGEVLKHADGRSPRNAVGSLSP